MAIPNERSPQTKKKAYQLKTRDINQKLVSTLPKERKPNKKQSSTHDIITAHTITTLNIPFIDTKPKY
jgi:hypothetical protein